MDRWVQSIGAVGDRITSADADRIEQTLIDAGAFAVRTVRGPIEDDMAFMRIPKCATSSIHFALARAYRSIWVREGHGLEIVDSSACDDVVDVWGLSTWQMRRYVLAYHLARSETRYVHGHFPVNRHILETYGDDYAFVTSLRDPVDRWISHYLYNRYLSPDRYAIDLEIEDFLETKRGRSIGRIYTGYFVGPDRIPEDGTVDSSTRERARENLAAFDAVGIVERMDHFREEIERKFGVEIEPRRRNQSPAPEGAKDVSNDVRERIREVCEPDIELYEFAKSRV